MTCSIDLNRPCSTSSRAPNRYTRKDLEVVATSCGLKNIKKKNMDELCQEIRTEASKQPVAPPPVVPPVVLPLPPPIGTNVPGKKCSPKSALALKPNYECNPATGKWKRKPGSLEYRYRYELNKLSDIELNNVAMKLGVDTPTFTRGDLIEEILEKQYPIIEDNALAKNIFVKKFKSIVREIAKQKKKQRDETIVTRVFETSVGQSLTTVNKILHLKSPLPFTSKLVSFKGSRDISAFKRKVANDISGIQRNEHWFALQKAYQMTLPFIEQLMVLTYTHGGDNMIHLYMDDLFESEKMYAFADRYKTTYVFPLFPAFVHLMVEDPNKFKELFLSEALAGTPWASTEKQTMDTLRKCGWRANMNVATDMKRGSDLMKKYGFILKNIFSRNQMSMHFYEVLLRRYIKILDQVIHRAPPLEHNIIVYKGSKNLDYFDFSKHNIYKNRRYLSVTFNANIAMSSSFTTTTCCLQRILLLRGTKLLYPILTYYQEYELLLPRERLLYATSPIYKPMNNTRNTINLVVTN